MFDTRIREQLLRQRRERLEQERLHLAEIVRKTLMGLRETYSIRSAYILGSLLEAHRWTSESDVDVAVGGCSEHLLSIMKELEDATGKSTDVMDLDSHPFPESVRRRGRKIYG